MESLFIVKDDGGRSEIGYENEPMDINETPVDCYSEEGEINQSSGDEKSITVQMPTNVTGIFTRNSRTDETGDFVGGFDEFHQDEAQRKLNRAKRFSLPLQTHEDVNKEKLTNLYKDLGINLENERHYRFNVIHMRGTENMSTEDVLEYFTSYGPSHVEWINDVSCNIIWKDDVSAARALLGLSKKVKNLNKVHLNADPFQKDFKDESPADEVDDDEAVDAREIKTAIPPGFWRIGVPSPHSSSILLRYATRSDKKQRNAEKNSEYYKKRGNPHFGNIPGLISNSLRTGVKKFKVKSLGTNSIWDSHADPEPKRDNPWEELAYEWGEMDRVREPNPRNNKISVHQRVNPIPDLRISLTSKKERAKRLRMDSESGAVSSDKEMWETRRKVPRMRMYADEEEKKLEKKLHNQSKSPIKEDLRSKINKKKAKTRFKFSSEKKSVEPPTLSSNSENECDDEDSGDWALEHYHDLRNSLRQNKKQEHKRFSAVKYESDSEDDDYNYQRDIKSRSPLQIEIENDEYYLNKD